MLAPDETRISLKAACSDPRLARDGRPASLASLYRWYLHGAKSVRGFKKRLDVEQGPRGITTSPEAIGRFLASLNDGNDTNPPVAVTTNQPRRPSGTTERHLASTQLDAIGI